jgi:CubicO group peptidase (beta-lactamase class C family)
VVAALVLGAAIAPRSASHAAPRDGGETLAAFLEAYRVGDCAAFDAFVRAHYHPKALARPDLVADFVASFARLREDLGPIERRSTGFDSTYRATRHHLYGPVSRQWVTLMFVHDDSTGKVRGHGLWRREAPPGWTPAADPRPPGFRLREHLNGLADAGLFSGVVLLAGPAGPIVGQAIGTADGRRPLTVEDRFPIASITKMFTAALILLLEEEGRLAFDEPIARHLPEYPRDIAGQVTIRHLLQHTSGIEIDDHAPFNAARELACTLDQAVAAQDAHLDSMNEGRRRDFRPLGRHDYSNENYDLLGAIAERAAGVPFGRLLERRVLAPAGLRATSFAGEPGLHGRTWKRGAGGAACATEGVAHAGRAGCPGPAGGLFSTAQDLARFMAWLRAPRAGRATLFERMTNGMVPAGDGATYGLGVEQLTAGDTAVGHNGGIAGASAELRWLAREGLILVALCNRERAAPDLLRFVLETPGP